ncbi:MAG TPA: DNA-binding protein [Clostridia bacterium]|nr:DNA-binding protein [Clostridia bacterium]
MQYREAKLGRIFVLRLEDGDVIPTVIEEFAQAQQIRAALVHFLGGADTGSRVVVGPEDGTALKPTILVEMLAGVHEAVGTGTIFPDEEGKPKLHLHAAFGRREGTVTGCTREGVRVWQIAEAVILELLEVQGIRKKDPQKGFAVLTLAED